MKIICKKSRECIDVGWWKKPNWNSRMGDWKGGQHWSKRHVIIYIWIKSIGKTALLSATENGQLEFLKFLLEHGANIESSEK